MEGLISAFGLDWKLLLIQGFNFALLLGGLSYFLYKPVMNMIDERAALVEKGVKNAQEADLILAASKQEGEELVGAAAREAESLITTARNRAEEKGSEIVMSAEAKAHALMLDAHARAEEAKRQAMLESEKEITRAAVLAAEKLIRERA